MKFTKEELTKKFQALGKLEKPEDFRKELAEFQQDLEADYDEHTQVVTERDDYKQKNADLKEANMDLYLQATARKKAEDKEKEKEPGKEPGEKRKFEDLFNEKGELK